MLSGIYFKKDISRLEFIHKNVQVSKQLEACYIMNYGFVSSGRQDSGYMPADLKYLREFFFFFFGGKRMLNFLRSAFISYLYLSPQCLVQYLTQTKHSTNICELKETTGTRV